MLKDKRCFLIAPMKTTTYTVREVATIISGSEDLKVVERVVRQVRYWTTEGLINPEGGRHTGSGRHRVYNPNEVRKAAITAELARHGVSISMLCSVEGYYKGIDEGVRWDRAVNGEEDVFYIFANEFGDDGGSQSYLVSSKSKVDPLDVLKSREVFMMEIGSETIPSTDYNNYPTCIIINLTKLFARLDLQ